MAKFIFVTDTPELENLLDQHPGWGFMWRDKGHGLLRVEHDGITAALGSHVIAKLPHPASTASRLASKFPPALRAHIPSNPSGTVHDLLVDAFGLDEDGGYY
jgi:hypothetical protein